MNSFFIPYMNKKSVNIFFVGMSCGIPFLLTTSILDIYLKTENTSNTMIGLFSILHIPFTFKFIFGPIVDKISIPFFTKNFGQIRGWTIFSHMILLIGLIGIAVSPPRENIYRLMIFAAISSFGNGIQNISLYNYQFDKIKQSELGITASIISIGFRIGTFITKTSSLYIAYYFNWEIAYIAMSFFLIIGIAFAIYANEPEITQTEDSIKARKLTECFIAKNKNPMMLRVIFFECLFAPIKIFMKDKDWKYYLSLIMLYDIGNVMIQKMSRVFFIEVGFSTLEIANVVQVFGTVASFVGGILTGTLIKNYDLKKCMLWTSAVHAVISLLMLSITFYGKNILLFYLVIFLEFSTGTAMSTCFLSFLYSLCKTGSPATQYALLWAFYELVAVIIRSFSGIYTDTVGWNIFFLTNPIFFIPGIALLIFLLRSQNNGNRNIKSII